MKLVAVALFVFGSVVTIPALADPPAATPTPAPAATPAPAPTTTATETTIHGRADKPNVLIELARPTAASAARDAHAQMRITWMKKLEPSTTRATR